MKRAIAALLAVLLIAMAMPFAAAANIASITISVPEIKGLEITLTDVQPVYSHEPFIFNPAQTPYSFYLGANGTVTFSKAVTLNYVDPMTFATVTKDIAANTAVSISEINGWYINFDDPMAGFASFFSDSDPYYSAGLQAASLDINGLKVASAAPSAEPSPSEAPSPSAPAAPAEQPATGEAPAPAEPAGAEPSAPATAEAPAEAPVPEQPAAAGAVAPPPVAADADSVYVTVSVDGKLQIAAYPVSAKDMNVDQVLKAAHAAYYSGGESGYTSGIDPTWNMFMISKCWGVMGTPYVIVNGAPLQAAVDTVKVSPSDNIIVAISSNAMVPPEVVSLEVEVSGGTATVKAIKWVLDFTTFSYTSSPYANAPVTDPYTGASLGTTDANGTVSVPASGVAAVGGAAAINVSFSSNKAGAAGGGATAPSGGSGAPASGGTAPAAGGSTKAEKASAGDYVIVAIIVVVIIVVPIVISTVVKKKKAKLEGSEEEKEDATK